MVSYVRRRSTTGRTLSDAEIVARYVAGATSGTIAFYANCDSTTVLDIVRAAGETVRRRGGRPCEDTRTLSDAEICQRYRDGLNGPEIARAATCALSSVYNILRRNNVERREPGEASRVNALAARLRDRSAGR